jgi:hypothetical protein
VNEKLKKKNDSNKESNSLNDYAKFIAEMIKKYQSVLIKG